MNLYQITKELEEVLNNFEIDEETGEVIFDTEAIEQLNLSKNEKIENIGKVMLNLKAEYTALKERKDAFDKRMKSVNSQLVRLLSYLDICLKGEEYKCNDFQIKYTKSERVEVTEDFFTWAKRHKEFLTIKEPEPNKTEIKKALKQGITVKGATITEHKNISIK